MWDWERASIPYQPIYRRRLLRRRVIIVLAILVVALPYIALTGIRDHQPLGVRVFDEVVTTVGMRYYDRSYHGKSWQEIARRHRAEVVGAPTVSARYAALRAMLAELHDSHTAAFAPGSAHNAQAREFGSRATKRISFFDRFARGHGVEERSLERAESLDGSHNASSSIDWRELRPGVGYLRLAAFPEAIAGVFGWAMADLKHDRALILDLRGNPGGLVDSVDAVAGVFLPEGTLVSTGSRRYHFFGPQHFTATREAGVTYDGKLVVLVDGMTRSGAESLARALQYYHRATLVGMKTAGQVLGVDVEIALADGGLLRVATLDMHAPDGVRLEGRGVIPDVSIADRAAQLPAATRLIGLEGPTTDASPKPKTLGVVHACPLTIRDFSLSSIGAANRVFEYRIGITPPSRTSVGASFVVSGEGQDAPREVTVTSLEPTADAILFYWPSRTLKSVSISAVDATASRSECDPADVTTLTERAPMISAQGPALESGETATPDWLVAELRPMHDAEQRFVPTFDDSTASTIAEGAGHVLREARMLRHVHPEYPEIAKIGGQEGDVLVAVTVGDGGRVLGTKVVSSWAGMLLDRAACRAAQRTPFSGARLDGEPAPRTYLIGYSFRLTGSLTGLEFAGDFFR